MAFRVGVLFNSLPGPKFEGSAVASLLREIEDRTKLLRRGEPLSVIAFVRANEEMAFSRDVASSGYSVDAAAWDEAGTTIRPVGALASVLRSPHDCESALDRGIEFVLSLSHVIVIVCGSSLEFEGVTRHFGSYENVWALPVLVSMEDGKHLFLEVDPHVCVVEAVDWFLKLKKRWQTANPDASSLPPAKTAVLGAIFPWVASIAIRQRLENVKKRPRSAFERCREGLGLSDSIMEKLTQEDQKVLSHHVELLCPFFKRHDDLAKYYSNAFRTTCILVPLLIAASTILAVAAVVDVDRHNLWHVMEAILLVFAGSLYLRSRLSGHHENWVQHRLTTELMRSSILSILLYTLPRLTVPAEEPEQWVRQTRVFWTYLRSLPALSFSTMGQDLLSARRTAVAEYAKYQETFHSDFAAQHYAGHKWLTKTSSRAFFVTLCVVTIQLAITYSPLRQEDLGVKLMIATLVCASGAFVLSVLTYQLGFEAIAERSTNAAQHFADLRIVMDRGAAIACAQDVYEWARQCASDVLTEQHSWYRHIPVIRMHL